MKGFDGIAVVVRNLNNELEKVKVHTAKGMLLAANLIRRDMEKTPPKIPVDTGNLRASWFTDVVDGKYGAGVLMGFTANYARWVHDMPMDRKFRRQGAGSGFFQSAILRNTEEIVKIMAENAKL